jgi:antitoxin component of MazEF toxin-antitoxin module
MQKVIESAIVSQWGNSKAIRIPAPIFHAANLELRDELIMTVEDDRIIMRKDLSVTKTFFDFAGSLSPGEAEVMLDALKDTERIDTDEW